MIGTTGSQMGQLRRPIRIHKLQNFWQAAVTSNQTLLTGYQPPNHRKDAPGNFFAILAHRMMLTAKNGTGPALGIAKHELANLIDDCNCVEVAFALCAAPCKQSMSSQHDAITAVMTFHRIFHHETQLKPRTLPGNPCEMMMKAAIEFLEAFESVSRGSQRDAPIRMKVVHMAKRKKSMQRGINGSSHVVLAESAERIEIHHLVFVDDAAIAALQAD